jgi:energy-converting hydrogenase Eha subunit F
MPRIAALILVLVLIMGLLVFFSTQAEEVPTTTIETEVSEAPDAR